MQLHFVSPLFIFLTTKIVQDRCPAASLMTILSEPDTTGSTADLRANAQRRNAACDASRRNAPHHGESLTANPSWRISHGDSLTANPSWTPHVLIRCFSMSLLSSFYCTAKVS